MISNHSEIHLKICNRKVCGKSPNTRKNKHTVYNTWIKEEIKRKFLKYSELQENENATCEKIL